jgi:hypothetical protein
MASDGVSRLEAIHRSRGFQYAAAAICGVGLATAGTTFWRLSQGWRDPSRVVVQSSPSPSQQIAVAPSVPPAPAAPPSNVAPPVQLPPPAAGTGAQISGTATDVADSKPAATDTAPEPRNVQVSPEPRPEADSAESPAEPASKVAEKPTGAPAPSIEEAKPSEVAQAPEASPEPVPPGSTLLKAEPVQPAAPPNPTAPTRLGRTVPSETQRRSDPHRTRDARPSDQGSRTPKRENNRPTAPQRNQYAQRVPQGGAGPFRPIAAPIGSAPNVRAYSFAANGGITTTRYGAPVQIIRIR